MPVWHEKTKALVASGELVVIGITQEQHPDRCELFAQWKGFDFPILWDPFGVTGLEVVPVVTAIDELGIVRLARPSLERFDEQFLGEFMVHGEEVLAEVMRPLGFRISDALKAQGAAQAMARLMRAGADAPTIDEDVAVLDAAAADSDSSQAIFHAGVAHRIRYDGPKAQTDDFRLATGAWGDALRARPNQYIWRRRIQQWGPRLDKPYPFYDWVGNARRAIMGTGQAPVQLRVPLSGSEIAGKSRGPVAAIGNGKAPDPEGKVETDAGKLVRLDTSVVPTTGAAAPDGSAAVRVHVSLRPITDKDGKGVTWTLDTYAPVLWVDTPEGWQPEQILQPVLWPTERTGEKNTERALISTDFGVVVPGSAFESKNVELNGYVLYSICLEDGTCVFRRQDFAVTIDAPQ